ncbi:MAG TPA: hypothetical protein VMY76_00340 [Gemmatimonadales bacterium]|nr:hypothetical protein [Gemmatimonadales bacterium]
MSRAITVLLAVGLCIGAQPASAQAASTGSGPLIRYGKWVLAAGAVGMNYLAARAHDRADERFDVLESRCLAERTLCDVDAAGHYTSGESERIFQESLHYDRQARRWLFGGETALLGAAAMFVWELTRQAPKPDNIPFEPEVRSLYRATGVGVRIGF